MSELFGNIHSLESCGTVDGPGIRFVVFMQGCPMRCQYCHNPDTWSCAENKKISVSEILTKFERIKEFLQDGGITVTGGEPMMQIEFVTELFKEARKRNIHTALDTSGVMFNPDNTQKVDELLEYTSLVLLDIKHIDDTQHKKLTGHSNKNILAFAKYLSEKNVPVWIRHVVIPTITDNEEYLTLLGKFLHTLKNVKAIDILPYHNMAIPKYEHLNIEYKLKDIPQLPKADAIRARDIIFQNMKNG